MRKPCLREDELVLICLFKVDLIFPFSNMHTDSSSFFSSTASRLSFTLSILFARYSSLPPRIDLHRQQHSHHASPPKHLHEARSHSRVTICECTSRFIFTGFPVSSLSDNINIISGLPHRR